MNQVPHDDTSIVNELKGEIQELYNLLPQIKAIATSHVLNKPLYTAHRSSITNDLLLPNNNDRRTTISTKSTVPKVKSILHPDTESEDDDNEHANYMNDTYIPYHESISSAPTVGKNQSSSLSPSSAISSTNTSQNGEEQQTVLTEEGFTEDLIQDIHEQLHERIINLRLRILSMLEVSDNQN